MRRSTIWLSLVVVLACRPFDPPSKSEIFRPCCGTLGTCVPLGLIPADVQSQVSADVCGNALMCVPKVLVENSTKIPTRCRAVGDGEGRCLPGCLPPLAAQAKRLDQSTCAVGELCAPCYDPRTGEDTQVCRLGSDPGPVERPRVFTDCCGGRARCVPPSIVAQFASETDREQLGSGSCAQREDTCVPEMWLDEAFKPAICRALGNLEGRCVLDCLPAVAKQSESLTRDSCAAGELCAPCFDPISGKTTSVCSQGEDRPAEAPKTFATCCSQQGRSHGRCVPHALLPETVSEEDTRRLGSDTCSASGELCIPEAWIDDAPVTPASCEATGKLEGRCLSTCFPDVAARASELDAASCAAAELCVPCFDPLSGEDTGACRSGSDRPQRPAQTFERCCGTGSETHGRCVPKTLLARTASAADLDFLGQDTCKERDVACVPNSWIDTPDIELTTCRALGSFEGRCLPSCLPEVRSQAESLDRDRCAESELCLPCFDPRTGTDTGVCRIGMDKPREPATEFESCCKSRGRCLPGTTLSKTLMSEDLKWLGQDTCDAPARCVPSEWIEQSPIPAPTACRALGDLEGRCLSTCLPQIASTSARLSRSSCDEGELCANCYNPQTLEKTGACDTGTDKPKEPARGFTSCCGSGAQARGTCVPVEFLSSDQRVLPRDSCNSYDARCVPQQLFAVPAKRIDACTTTLSGPGLCFDTCFLESTSATVTSVLATCGQNGRCVPCSAVSTTGIGCE